MARLSMPARKPRASTSSSSSSSRKAAASSNSNSSSSSSQKKGKDSKVSRSSASSSKHYASVLVGKLFDQLAEEKLTVIKKNKNTVAKWLSKMRMSVLKKVSDSSKVMFSEAPADYSLEIAELRRDIGELRQKVLEAASERIKSSTAVQEASNVEVQDPGFAPKISSIGGKITQVAHQMDALGKDLQARSQAFSSTYAVVESSWSEKYKQAAAEGARRSARNAMAAPAVQQLEPISSIGAPLSPSSDAVFLELLAAP